MVEGTTLGSKNPEEIRQEIEGARASLDEKIQSLESNVQGAIETAKEKLTPAHYIESHPWACVGAAVGVGFLVGQLTVSAAHSDLPSFYPPKNFFRGNSGGNGSSNSGGNALASTGLMLAATKFFDKEIRDLKSYAISQAMGVVKEFAKSAVAPELSPRVDEVLDRATRYFGAQPAPSDSSSSFGGGVAATP